MSLRSRFGPVIELHELVSALEKHRKRADISQGDIEMAVHKLADLESGFEIIDLKGKKVVATLPLSMSNDAQTIMSFASENGGLVHPRECIYKTNFTEARFHNAMVSE